MKTTFKFATNEMVTCGVTIPAIQVEGSVEATLEELKGMYELEKQVLKESPEVVTTFLTELMMKFKEAEVIIKQAEENEKLRKEAEAFMHEDEMAATEEFNHVVCDDGKLYDASGIFIGSILDKSKCDEPDYDHMEPAFDPEYCMKDGAFNCEGCEWECNCPHNGTYDPNKGF